MKKVLIDLSCQSKSESNQSSLHIICNNCCHRVSLVFVLVMVKFTISTFQIAGVANIGYATMRKKSTASWGKKQYPTLPNLLPVPTESNFAFGADLSLGKMLFIGTNVLWRQMSMMRGAIMTPPWKTPSTSCCPVRQKCISKEAMGWIKIHKLLVKSKCTVKT